MIFESHAHYDDEAFDGDREELLASFAGQGIPSFGFSTIIFWNLF